MLVSLIVVVVDGRRESVRVVGRLIELVLERKSKDEQ